MSHTYTYYFKCNIGPNGKHSYTQEGKQPTGIVAVVTIKGPPAEFGISDEESQIIPQFAEYNLADCSSYVITEITLMDNTKVDTLGCLTVGHPLPCDLGVDTIFMNFKRAFFNNFLNNFLPPNDWTGKFEDWYHNGTLRGIIHYKDGVKDGPYETYYPDGTIETKQSYVNDMIEGPYTIFNQDGDISYKCSYHNGKLHGKECMYYDDGTISKIGNYVNGLKEGKFKERDENGNRVSEEFYVNGELHGDVRKWNSNGLLVSYEFYVNGELHGDVGKWNNDGVLIYRAVYDDGTLVSEEKINIKEGSIFD